MSIGKHTQNFRFVRASLFFIEFTGLILVSKERHVIAQGKIERCEMQPCVVMVC